MLKKVLYPGSFDPFHAGHQFVYNSACDLVGHENVWIGLATDIKKFMPSKQFPTPISKCEFRRWTIAPIGAKTVIVRSTSVETCNEIGADFMVRGLRPSYDLPQEAALDFWNSRLSGGMIRTLFFMTPDTTNHLSSTAIREMINYDPTGKKCIGEFMNPYVLARWKHENIPTSTLYFGPKCVGKSTYLQQLGERYKPCERIYVKDCDKTIWENIRVSENDRKVIENNFRRAIWEKDRGDYDALMYEMGKNINWANFLNPEYSYEVSALGAYFKYIPPEVVGQFKLVKLNTTPEERMKRAEKRDCLRTLDAFDYFYEDPPFFDEEIVI